MSKPKYQTSSFEWLLVYLWMLFMYFFPGVIEPIARIFMSH